jgi:hypothetical protein
MLTAIQDSKIKVYKDNCKKQQSISKKWGKACHEFDVEHTSGYYL